jgi:hypothetical protein
MNTMTTNLNDSPDTGPVSFECEQIAQQAEANIAKYCDPSAIFGLAAALIETNKLIASLSLNLSRLAKGVGL